MLSAVRNAKLFQVKQGRHQAPRKPGFVTDATFSRYRSRPRCG
jgi:hypothetical protein